MKLRFCLSAVCLLTFLRGLSDAAPIQLQATSVIETNGYCNHYTVSGSNFNLQDNIFGFCGGSPYHYASGGDTLNSFVLIAAPDSSMPILGQGQTLGQVNLPEAQGRLAYFTGTIRYAEPAVSIPLSANGTLQLATEVHLQGTLNACLLPVGFTGGSCDPAFANYATVNVDLTGMDTFFLTCDTTSFCQYTESFAATTASVPEPASFFMLCPAGLLAVLRIAKRRQTISSANSAKSV